MWRWSLCLTLVAGCSVTFERAEEPLLGQVDLAPAYLAALIEDQVHHDHEAGSLGEAHARREAKASLTVAEMARILSPDEGARLARGWQSEPRLNPRVKQILREQLLSEWD